MDNINFSAFCLVILVALVLAMCGVLLINSSTNIAYALESGTGYYDSNLFPNNDCTTWDYDYTLTGSWVNLYSSSNFTIDIYGTGSISNNTITCTGGSYVELRVNFDTNDYDTSSTKNFCVGVVGTLNTSAIQSTFFTGYRSGSLVANTTYNVYSTNTSGSSNPTNINSSGYMSVYVYQGYTVTLRFIGFYLRTSFNGYVPKTYSNYGYDQGYTDGVNSASGGTSDIPLDLTNVSWRSPSIAIVSNVNGLYDVDGSLDSSYTGSNFTFDKIQLISGNTIFGEDGEYSPMYLINSSLSIGEGTIPVMANELLTFIGGDDVANAELIDWLQVNNGFLSYTDGYQEGYNTGHQIGYDEGFERGAGAIYTGVLSDYTILSDYYSIGISNNSLNISDDSEVLSSLVMYSNFTINGYTINYGRYDIVGSDNYSGVYTLTLTGSTGYSGYKVSSFNIDENSIYKFMFNPEDTFNICISVPEGGGTYLYWTYALQTDGYINGVPYMDLTPYIKPWASHISCDIYLYNPVVRLLDADPVPLVLHNRTPIFGLVANNLIVDNSNGNYNQGFKDGQLQGEQIGYANGWNKGINSSSNNFLGLFSAVLDAPVNVISQTLDFDLLGFNLRDFFFSMVSIAVILFILRLIL